MSPRWVFAALLVLAAVSSWLLFVGPKDVLGIDTGNAGVIALIAVCWLSLIAVARMPRTGIDNEISPGEWRAWVALAFVAVMTAYSLVQTPVFDGAPIAQNPDAGRVGRRIALLVVAWIVLDQVLRARWQGLVIQDERDREIEARAGGIAHTTLIVLLFGFAVLLGFTPSERLNWAPAPVIAHLLVVGWMLSCVVERAVAAFAYWRDRR